MNRAKKQVLFLALLQGLCIIHVCASSLHVEKTIIFKGVLLIDDLLVTADRLYIAERNTCTIYIADHKGNIISKFGSIGEGPGDLKYYNGMAYTEKELLVYGGRKINIYTLDGKYLGMHTTKKTVFNVIPGKNRWYYELRVVDKKENFFIPSIRLYDNQDNLLYSMKDDTVQTAVHTNGSVDNYPWFPSPYANEVYEVPDREGSLLVFKAREKRIFWIKNEKVEIIPLKFAIDSDPVTENDRAEFFSYIHPKPSEVTKRSVKFPSQKELFYGVICWGSDFALIRKTSFIIVNDRGEKIEEIPMPKEIVENRDWSWPSIGYLLKFFANKLYYFGDGERILVFSLF